jgi:hypothetical protein
LGFLEQYADETVPVEILSPIFGGETTIKYLIDGQELDSIPNVPGRYTVILKINNDFYWNNLEEEYLLTINIPCGDLDKDFEISIIDVRLLLQKYISDSGGIWTQDELKVGDINKDGAVDIIDVRMLLQMSINA